MTAADKLRELLATRPAMPNTEELVRWWRSVDLVSDALGELERWAKAGQAVVNQFDPMAHCHRAEPHTVLIVAEAARAAHLSVRGERDKLRNNLAELMRYVDEAKAAAGTERVSGQPLAESFRSMRADLEDARAEAKEYIATLGVILATCVEVGGTPCDAPSVAVRKVADALIEAREDLRTANIQRAMCTGHLAHDEFTPCPVHDVAQEAARG